MKEIQEKVATSFFGRSLVRGQIWPNFKVIQALMYVIVTCKYEKDLRKHDNTVSPIISRCELSIAMETRVLI